MSWNGAIIDKLGSYRIERLEYIVHITKNDDAIIHYSVTDEFGTKIIESTEKASIFHRWCIFWDKQDKLWFWSSDIGGFFWEKDSFGKYKQHEIYSDGHFKQMPLEVFRFLPSSLIRKLKEKGIDRL